MSFETFSPIWSHVNETDKKIVKNQNFEKENKIIIKKKQTKNGLEIW